MSLLSSVLILCIAFLAGVEGILDEFQFHQPLVACILVGLVSGYLEEGIFLGGYLQMMALGWANVGAAVAPDVALASIAASIFMVYGKASLLSSGDVISVAIAIAIPVSVIGLYLTGLCRNQAISLVQRMDQYAQDANVRAMSRYQWIGICMQGLRVMIPAAVLLLIPNTVVADLFMMIPDWLLRGLNVARGMLPALGFAIVINVLASKETWVFFALGFGLACIPQLSLMTLVIIGAALMVLYMMLKKDKPSVSDSDIEDALDEILEDY